MAARLQSTVPFPLLLDPEQTLRRELDLAKLSVGQLMSVSSAKNYAGAIGTVRNFAVQPSEAQNTPAVAILDADQKVVWQHVGKALGDYPAIDEILANLPAA